MTPQMTWEPETDQELERRMSMMGMDGDRARRMKSRIEAIAQERGGAVTVADIDEASKRAVGGGVAAAYRGDPASTAYSAYRWPPQRQRPT